MADYWWRSWHGAPMDHKWAVIAARSNVKPGIVSAVAWALLDYASQQPNRGDVAGFDIETYSVFSGFSEGEVAAVIDAMTDKGIISNGRFSAWEERQPVREDDSGDRVRNYREKKRTVTQRNASERVVTQRNAPDTDTDTESETETDSDAATAAWKAPAAVLADTKPLSFLPPNLKNLSEDQILFLQIICRGFDEKIANTAQGQLLVALRGKYGQEKVLEAFNYYATQGIRLDEAVRRANGALPTWGQGQKRTFPRQAPSGYPAQKQGTTVLDRSMNAINEFIQEHSPQ